MYIAYGTFTLYEWSWWSCSTQVERELSFLSAYVLYYNHGHSQKVTIPCAVYIKFDLMRMSVILFETCRGL